MSTTVLRDLVARLGFQSDAKGFDEADRRIEKIKRELLGLNAATAKGERAVTRGGRNAAASVERASRRAEVAAHAGGGGLLGTLGQFFAAGTIGAFIKGTVELASHVDEVDNVLETVFGKQGIQQIRDWSADVATAVGRSRYSLQEYAAQVGTLLSTLIKDPAKLREMSTTLSALAVDLASFKDSTDEEALQAITSALAGQSEPLRRYAVNILDASLNEFAHARGITTKVEKMKLAQKTELIYAKIIHDTALMQGDAAKTAGTFANRTRALTDGIKDLRIALGRDLLPAGNKMLEWMIRSVDWFLRLNAQTNLAQTSVLALAAAFAFMWRRALLGSLPALAAMAALYLVFDEIYTLLNGGDTLIEDFLKHVYGDDEGHRKVEEIREAVHKLGEAIKWVGEQIAKLPSLPAWMKRTSDMLSNANGSLVTKAEYERMQAIKLLNEERDAIISQNAYNAELRSHGVPAPEDTEVPAYVPSRAEQAVLDAAERRRRSDAAIVQRRIAAQASAEGLIVQGAYAGNFNPQPAGPSATIQGASSVTINEGDINVNIGTDTNGQAAASNVRRAAVDARNTRRTVTRGAAPPKPQ